MKRSGPPKRTTPLERRTPLRAGRPKPKASFTPASDEQRAKVKIRSCLVHGCGNTACDAAHVVSRALGGCDDPACVVGLCREHHRAFDQGHLDLLPFLEPHHRVELAHAVGHLGLVGALQRITNTRWTPDRKAA